MKTNAACVLLQAAKEKSGLFVPGRSLSLWHMLCRLLAKMYCKRTHAMVRMILLFRAFVEGKRIVWAPCLFAALDFGLAILARLLGIACFCKVAWACGGDNPLRLLEAFRKTAFLYLSLHVPLQDFLTGCPCGTLTSCLSSIIKFPASCCPCKSLLLGSTCVDL